MLSAHWVKKRKVSKGLVTSSSDFRVSQYFGLPTDRLPTFRLSISDLFHTHIL